MTKIMVCRTSAAMLPAEDLEIVKKFLFGVFDGVGEIHRRAWRIIWRRIIKLAPGEITWFETIIPRNGQFHKKFFVLLEVGFDAWEPDRVRRSYRGKPILKNFDLFREEVTILAGYYEQTFDLRGRMRLRALSISFANMEEPDFERLYSAVIDVLLREVCKNYKNRSEIDAVVNEIMLFV